MRYVALAAGYDGTLARNGASDPRCLEALRALAATGRKLILVTARELRDLLETFPDARIFDYVIAENGAVMHRVASRQSEILAQAPSEMLLQELQRRRITPLSVGSSIVTTAAANMPAVQEIITRLHLDCQLVRNEDALIISPPEVNKASGVGEALRDLAVSPHNLVCIGDAQNDLALFELAEHRVAVANADPDLKRAADRVVRGEYCDGFLEIAHELLKTDLLNAPPRHVVPLGMDVAQQEPIALSPYSDSLLVAGPDGSGKAAYCNHLLHSLLERGYQCCIIGTNVPLGAGPPVKTFGDAHDVPRLTDVLTALERPETSVSIDLSGLQVDTRPVFAEALLVQLQALHDRVGLPHCVFVHHAERFLTGREIGKRAAETTMVYTTAQPQSLPAQIAECVHWTVLLDECAQPLGVRQAARARHLEFSYGSTRRRLLALERGPTCGAQASAAGAARETSSGFDSDEAGSTAIDSAVSALSG